MTKKEIKKQENKPNEPKTPNHKNEANSEIQIINVMANASIILMSVMMGAFTDVMVKATGAVAEGIADAIGGKEAQEKVCKELETKLPEVGEKIALMISETRKELYAQFEQKRKKLKPYLTDPALRDGPKIVEKYDFKLPKLTEELDDKTLAQYVQLFVSENVQFAEMFKELTSWIERMPKLPAKKGK
jgi:hypothetical protein